MINKTLEHYKVIDFPTIDDIKEVLSSPLKYLIGNANQGLN